jgi:hypothetical protein
MLQQNDPRGQEDPVPSLPRESMNMLYRILRPPRRKFPPRCPYCSGELPKEVKRADALRMWCVPRQARSQTEETKYSFVHVPSRSQAKTDATWICLDHLNFPPDYLNDIRLNRVRFVSVIGPTHSGKTSWLRSVGSQTVLPKLGLNHLRRWFHGTGTFDQGLSLHCAKLALGTLPDSDPVLGPCTTYSVRVGPERRRQPRLHVVLKDIGGETLKKQREDDILEDVHKKHLWCSEWHLFIINARSEGHLDESLLHAHRWIERLHTPIRDNYRVQNRLLPRAIVAFSQCDSSGAPSALMNSLRKGPNRFHHRGSAFSLSDYLGRMRENDREVRSFLEARDDVLLKQFEDKDLFSGVHFTAFSALGSPPADRVVDSNGELAKVPCCLTEPACVRVMDPILWIMSDEKII